MKHVLLFALLWMLVTAVQAQTYTDANLNGAYAFQSTSPQTYSWFKSFTCPSNSSVSYGVNGSQTTQQILYGVATFDGKGNISITLTKIGNFNATASANTTSVTWNSQCQVTSVNTGHVVYGASTTNTQTGTYTVQSNGTGTITAGGTSTFVLAGTNSSGISTTILVAGNAKNGSSINTTIAIHQ